MDENNKDKLINKGKDDADELGEETFVFRRDPDDLVVSRQKLANTNARPKTPPGQTQNRTVQRPNQTQRPNTARPDANQPGGAVIKPLKPEQPNRPINQTVINPTNNRQNSQQTSQNRPQNQIPVQYSGQTVARGNVSGTPRVTQNQRPTQTPSANRPAANQPTQSTAHTQRPPQTANRSGANSSEYTNRTVPHQQNRANQPESLPVRRTPNTAEPNRYQNYRTTPEVNNDWQAVERQTIRRNAARDSASSAIMSAVKAVIYIVFVIAVSVPLSIFVINTANDVFAFKKEEKIVEVTIPEYTTIEDLGDILGEAGVIKYPWAFKLWTNIKEKRNIENGNYPEYVPGDYEVNTNQNYDYIRATFKKSTKRETVTVMIPEGSTVDEIIELLVANGVSTRDELVDAINNYEFDYRFVNELQTTSDRFYRLEGYLFPDTYEFYKDSSAATAIDKFLQNFNKKFAEGYYARCTDLGITVDQAITLASMIEKEARYAADLGDVSSVFNNRLSHSATFPTLDSDATVAYAMQHDSGTRPDTLTGEDMEYDSPYNTYTHKGLPPGPIANPGLNAIRYALYPNATPYYFFVSDSTGHMLFAETYEEHLANIRKARSS